jgi:peptidoglycan hydrolase-like protein with peptidoglycan-binding domain
MDDFNARTRAEFDRPRRRADDGAVSRRASAAAGRADLASRPDRVALWAFLMAIAVTIAAAASAQAGSGGVAVKAAPGACADADLGERKLALGDCGADVKTLNSILDSKQYERGVGGKTFASPTAATVREFQQREGLTRTGEADSRTQRKLVRSMDRDVATWYGPGLYGNRTACGQTLEPKTVGVAHKHLPCGTKVTFSYRGRYLTTKVIDRGPFANGASWDLTNGAADKLGFKATDELRAAPAR